MGCGGPGDIDEVTLSVCGDVALVTWPKPINLRAIDILRQGRREDCGEEDREGKHAPRANTEIHGAIFT